MTDVLTGTIRPQKEDWQEAIDDECRMGGDCSPFASPLYRLLQEKFGENVRLEFDGDVADGGGWDKTLSLTMWKMDDYSNVAEFEVVFSGDNVDDLQDRCFALQNMHRGDGNNDAYKAFDMGLVSIMADGGVVGDDGERQGGFPERFQQDFEEWLADYCSQDDNLREITDSWSCLGGAADDEVHFTITAESDGDAEKWNTWLANNHSAIAERGE